MSSESPDNCYIMIKDEDVIFHLDELVELKTRIAQICRGQRGYISSRLAFEIADIADSLDLKIRQLRELQSDCDRVIVNGEYGSAEAAAAFAASSSGQRGESS